MSTTRAAIAGRFVEDDAVLGMLFEYGLRMSHAPLSRRGATVAVCGVTAYAATLSEAAANALALILVPEVEA